MIWAGRNTRLDGNGHVRLCDSVVLSMPLSVFSGVAVGVGGFVSDAEPAHFYSVA